MLDLGCLLGWAVDVALAIINATLAHTLACVSRHAAAAAAANCRCCCRTWSQMLVSRRRETALNS